MVQEIIEGKNKIDRTSYCLFGSKGVKKNWKVMKLTDYLSKRSLIIAVVLTVVIFVGSVGVALWGH